MGLERKQFRSIDLTDSFFDSLKADYEEFEEWFVRKAENWAYIHTQDDGTLDGFLYLKIEDDAVTDMEPELPPARRVKVGTFKIEAHGTKLGERFVKKIFDHAVEEKVNQLYVTIFEKHAGLVALFHRYGFERVGYKNTVNGTELVLLRDLNWRNDVSRDKNYPLIKMDGAFYHVGIYPAYHTRLLPDSILNNENVRIVEDVSHANSINKIFLSRINRIMNMSAGDKVVMYRTGDGAGPAEYRAVATSLCVVEEARRLDSFADADEFIAYARSHSVFSDDDLRIFFDEKKYLFALKFTYNIALRRRLTRHHLIENVGIHRNAYPGFIKLTRAQYRQIAIDGGIDESLIID
ncbi:N-acetyltransferase [Achromobacter spanius]|uniref:N-acetyltransferase n=1 Tax=Achromobacter spanius TaxID=217203 RepID=A0A2S0I115_9BURK|nr:N-acetyltransferase [Achromobacter spanius]AVJ25708.1 N-acetyltransferase [Achromobacter spanius]